MQPVSIDVWFVGPLRINKKVFQSSTETKTQWSVEMEGSLVVVSEQEAERMIQGKWQHVRKA